MPFVRRTRAILRRAEFGFFGVTVATRVQTPRRWGADTRFLRPCPDLRPGVVTFFFGRLRPLRTSWFVFGTAEYLTDLAQPRGNTLLRMQERPILAVDVDGVISLFGFDEPPDRSVARMELIDGSIHYISQAAGSRLGRLAEHYELIWATGWEDRANFSLPLLLGIPELHHLTFDGAARFGSAHWKLGPLTEYARGRALAWIDDSFDESCYEWARERQANGEPTLLVPTESHLGIEEVQVDALSAWARGFERERRERSV